MNTYLRILSYAKPYQKTFSIYGLFILLHVLFDLLSFTLLVPLLDIIFEQDKYTFLSDERIGISLLDDTKSSINQSFFGVVAHYGKVGALSFVCIGMLISNLFTNLFFYLSQRILANARSNIIVGLRSDLFKKINRLELGFFSSEKRGDLISRITSDVQEVEQTIVGSIRVIFRDPFKILIIFLYLFSKDIKLTFFCLGIMPFAALIITLISKKLRKFADKSQSILGDILEIVNETIGGIRIVKAFSRSSFMRSKFENANVSYGSTLKQMAYKRDLASPLSQLISVSFVTIILFYGGYLVLTSKTSTGLSPSEFLTFIIIFARILEPAKAIAASVSDLQRGLVSGRRIFEVLDLEEKIKQSAEPKEITDFENCIQFHDFTFSYENQAVLKSINLTIKKRQSVALVGPSGAGKSTLMDMIPRFYDPQKGIITIDGVDIRQFDISDLRSLMGIVTQDAILFNDSVYHNISFGLECTKNDVIEAAKIANAHDFIEAMEEGYETIVGDRGVKLSGGQKQRITIARAILKNPPILLLDEATSSLDSESELLVQDALNNLMKNRTSLVICLLYTSPSPRDA